MGNFRAIGVMSATALAISCGGGGGVSIAPVVPAISLQPVGVTVLPGANAAFRVAATGTPTPTYLWNRNGTPIAGATDRVYVTQPVQASDNGASFSVTVSNAAGTVTTAPAPLTVLPDPLPVIVTQPSDRTVYAGQDAVFTLKANGMPPLVYSWSKLGSVVVGTAATLVLPSVQLADSGSSYTGLVLDPFGAVASASVTLTVLPAPAVPIITSQPTAISVPAGNAPTFAVMAAGVAPLRYQWSRDGAEILGATGPSYTLPSPQLSDTGAAFAVQVGNGAGQVVSAVAILTVTAPAGPVLSSQPASVVTLPGLGTTFSAQASGSEPLTYQWLRNGTAVPGATGPAYTLTPTASDSGAQFQVQVGNGAGQVASSLATLTLVPWPDVYILGLAEVSGVLTPGYWLNGTWVGLSIPQPPAGRTWQSCRFGTEPMGIASKDVYVLGTFSTDYVQPDLGGYWLNGAWTPLPGGFPLAVYLNQGSVLACGMSETGGTVLPCWWSNGAFNRLTGAGTVSTGEAVGMAVLDGKLVLGGYVKSDSTGFVPGTWSGRAWTPLPVAPSGSGESDVCQVGADGVDLWMIGYTGVAFGYWLDGIWVNDPVPAFEDNICFHFSDGKVYVAGNWRTGDPGYWGDGHYVPLPALPGPSAPMVEGIDAKDGIVYVVGSNALNPGYWANGTWIPLAPPPGATWVAPTNIKVH